MRAEHESLPLERGWRLAALLAATLLAASPRGHAGEASACPVPQVQGLGSLAPLQRAAPGAASRPVAGQVVRQMRVIHHRVSSSRIRPMAASARNPQDGSDPSRRDGPQAMAYAILDSIGARDPDAFRSAVEKALPDPAHRRRADFLRLHMDPLVNAFDRGDLAVAEQLLRWDPTALSDSQPPFPRDDALARVFDHWRYAAREDVLDHQDADPPVAPDPRIASDHVRLARLLLDAGARPGARAAMIAEAPPSAEVNAMVEELLHRGLSINAAGPPAGAGQIAPFALAARAQNVELVRTMMRIERPDQRSLDQALLLTPMTQGNPLVPLLFESGADINSKVDVGFATDPLFTAALRWRYQHEEELIRLLIRHRADPNRTPPGRNESPLTIVLGDPGLALALLDLGADVAWHDSQGFTPLHRLARTRRQDPYIDLAPGDRARLASALLARGADANALDAEGHTPLMYLSADQVETMDVLLQAGGTIHVADRDWRS